MHPLAKAIIYFLLSIVITWWFIVANPVYNTFRFKLVAMSIASLVWGIQVVGAFVFLKEKKYLFLEKAGLVCFWGSAFLLISVLVNFILQPGAEMRLQVSGINVLLSVVLMAVLFARFLKRLQLSYSWVILWLLCLAVAVPTQAKLVGLW